jgi:tripartite-type tricarboxylate transporter receptor subunit TctC
MHATGSWGPWIGALALAAACIPAARAQDYPLKPVRIVNTQPPGAASDIVGRVLAENFSRTMGVQFIPDNRPGAGGNIAAAIVAKSPPDGYTLFIASIATHGINPAVYSQLGFDPVKDFTHLMLVATTPNILVVLSSMPARSVKELVALAKAHPGEVTYSSGGTGTSMHMAGELFAQLAHIRLAHIPYKGTPQGLTGVIGGEVAMMFPNLPVAVPHIKSGRLRSLGVTSAARLSRWPDIPTIAESGLPEYELAAWFGLSAPARLPDAIVKRLNAEANRIVAIPAVREQFGELGMEVQGGTPQAYGRLIETELARWSRVVKAAGLKLD